MLKAVLQSQLVVSWVAVVSFVLVWFGLGFFCFFLYVVGESGEERGGRVLAFIS